MSARRLWLLLGLIGSVVLVAVAGALIARRLSEPASHGRTISGSVILHGNDPTGGPTCEGGRGFDDLRSGAPVTVKNESGKIIGLGSLDIGATSASTTCEFPFEVDDVGNAKVYEIEVAHRGGVVFKRSDLEGNGWKVSLTIG